MSKQRIQQERKSYKLDDNKSNCFIGSPKSYEDTRSRKESWDNMEKYCSNNRSSSSNNSSTVSSINTTNEGEPDSKSSSVINTSRVVNSEHIPNYNTSSIPIPPPIDDSDDEDNTIFTNHVNNNAHNLVPMLTINIPINNNANNNVSGYESDDEDFIVGRLDLMPPLGFYDSYQDK
ncbi:MAG: hypothetical protein AABY27_02555 [Pseudomonadota bacterium]